MSEPGHRPGRVMLATAQRVVLQLRHDPRTIGMMVVAPVLLTGLLAWILSGEPEVFDEWGAPIIGIFPLVIMFLVTSIATLRERTGGTLERLMTMPMSKADFLGGYALAFGVMSVVQAVVVSAVSFGLYGLDVAGPVWAVVVMAVLNALLGTSLGLFVSAFARTEFQAVQFMPVVVIPQLLLCGLIAPRSALPAPLEAVSYALPLTYAMNAMQTLTTHPGMTGETWRDMAVVAAFVLALIAAGATTLQRQTD